MTKTILITLLLSVLLVSEIRGALFYAAFNSSYRLPLYYAYIISVIGNICVTPLCYLFLNTIHKILYRFEFYRRIFDRTISRAQLKLSEKMNRYGIWGLMLFVSVPVPVTGAWTGNIASWMLGVTFKRSLFATSLGIMISGIIVCIIIQAMQTI